MPELSSPTEYGVELVEYSFSDNTESSHHRILRFFQQTRLSATMADPGSAALPSGAHDAVLVKSDEMPKDAQQVEELDFNKIKGPITAEDLFLGTRNMGFQASSIGEAIRIINDMVSYRGPQYVGTTADSITSREHGVTQKLGTRPRSSSDTLLISSHLGYVAFFAGSWSTTTSPASSRLRVA